MQRNLKNKNILYAYNLLYPPESTIRDTFSEQLSKRYDKCIITQYRI